MNWEYSCGAVVFTRENGHILFAIVQEQAGAYSFPKGHMESNETEMETARREILEETGLNPDFLPGFKAEDEYDLAEKPGTRKRVTYFLAEFLDRYLCKRTIMDHGNCGFNDRISYFCFFNSSLLFCRFEHKTTNKI